MEKEILHRRRSAESAWQSPARMSAREQLCAPLCWRKEEKYSACCVHARYILSSSRRRVSPRRRNGMQQRSADRYVLTILICSLSYMCLCANTNATHLFPPENHISTYPANSPRFTALLSACVNQVLWRWQDLSAPRRVTLSLACTRISTMTVGQPVCGKSIGYCASVSNKEQQVMQWQQHSNVPLFQCILSISWRGHWYHS